MCGRSGDADTDARGQDPAGPLSWTGSLLRADRLPLPGRRGRTVDGVRLTLAGLTAEFALRDLVEFLDGEQPIAESRTSPLTFLARPGAAAPTSAAADWIAGVPEDAVMVLVAPMDAPPAAVLTGAELTGFASWVRGSAH